MCDENNIEKCGPEGIVVNQLEKAFINHCKDNIISEDCKDFYNKEYKINDFIIKINKSLKEEKILEQKNNFCRNENNIYKDDCIKFANNNTSLQGYIASLCAQGTDKSKEICKSICDNYNSGDILKKITCEYDYTAIALIILIIFVFISFIIILKTIINRRKNVNKSKQV
jgi:hypothetical protein